MIGVQFQLLQHIVAAQPAAVVCKLRISFNIAQLLGNLPIVHRVGGLVKVLDGETGFSYIDNSADSLAGAMRRAMGVYAGGPEAMARMQVAAVECIDREHTWKTVMGAYVQLYRESMRRWQD